jgi:hypothetical protein
MLVRGNKFNYNDDLMEHQTGIYLTELNPFTFQMLKKDAMQGIDNIIESSGKTKDYLLQMFQPDLPQELFFTEPTKSRNSLETELMKLANVYINTYPDIESELLVSDIDTIDQADLYIERMWINYQRPTEFLPLHSHSGLLSFVVWTHIPYSFNDDLGARMVLSASKDRIGKFEFVFCNSLGAVRTLRLPVDTSFEGTICIFPAKMYHQVYPFYNVNDFRVTVSGNIRVRRKH